MTMTFEEAKAVRLDESTDAGEFLYQCLYRAIPDRARYSEAEETIIEQDPQPEALAKVITVKELNSLLSHLGQYGMSFESEIENPGMDQETRDLAERGIQSAEKFVRAARVLREWMDKHEGEK